MDSARAPETWADTNITTRAGRADAPAHWKIDVELRIDYARAVNPALEILQVSAQTGAGMDAWYAWLRARIHDEQALVAAV